MSYPPEKVKTILITRVKISNMSEKKVHSKEEGVSTSKIPNMSEKKVHSKEDGVSTRKLSIN